ncbi:MAG: VWA domain-containing protein [Gemmatimonadales bacterium]
MMFASVGFQRPDLLVLAPLAALLFAVALGSQWRRLRRLADAYRLPALQRLWPERLGRFPTVRLLCSIGAGLALGVAAAGPTWTVPASGEPLPPLDMAIAVDLSLSMSATDAAPTRIARARALIARLSEELPSVRFSLVAFAGWPYTILPPTDDPALLRYFAQSLDVSLIQPQDRGTALGDALALAGYTLEARPTPDARKAVLVLTDGDATQTDNAVAVASELSDAGIEVWVGALGSDVGSPLLVDGAPVLEGGRPVVAARDEPLLREVSRVTSGRYFDVNDEAGAEALISSLREVSGDTEDPPPPPVDAAFLLVLAAIPLLLWEAAADAGRTWRVARTTEGAAS